MNFCIIFEFQLEIQMFFEPYKRCLLRALACPPTHEEAQRMMYFAVEILLAAQEQHVHSYSTRPSVAENPESGVEDDAGVHPLIEKHALKWLLIRSVMIISYCFNTLFP